MIEEFLEQSTINFYQWEKYGRGYLLYPYSVQIEPPYLPLHKFSFVPERSPYVDDGRVPSLLEKVSEFFSTKERVQTIQQPEEPLPEVYTSQSLRTFKITFPNDADIQHTSANEFITLCSSTHSPVAFEIIGTKQSIQFQITCNEKDFDRIQGLWKAYFSLAVLTEVSSHQLPFTNTGECAICDFGLDEEFMRPIIQADNFRVDPLISIISAFEHLQEGETAMLQILFQGVVYPWAQIIVQSVSDGKGGSFFVDSPEMVKLAQEKVKAPLYSVVMRIVTESNSRQRTALIAENLIANIVTVSDARTNRLIPLSNERYDFDRHFENVFTRLSNRLGMFLNGKELVSFVHYPSLSVVSSKLRGYEQKTKPVPQNVLRHDFELGVNIYLGQETKATLNIQQRLRHMHVIGSTGTGKSNFLLQSIIQDIHLGNGLCVLDPHGDLIEKAIQHIPENRIKDVVLLDPSDTDFPIGLNLLFAKTEPEKIILSSDIVSLFKRFATSWGDQMTSVLANAVIAFLEHEEGGTFLDLRKFLTDDKFRAQTLQKVQDPNITYYWKKEFPLLRSNSIAPILTRLDTFLRPKIVRNMMVQKSGIDFHDVINSKKIFLVKLSQGLIGEDNSYLLGSIIVAKLHQAALHRQNMKEHERLPFFLYIDEFQHFITPSMSSILSGARKYGLGLVLAHQDLEQLRTIDKELANSVLSNPATRVCFRCGEEDAKNLATGFSYFDETDIQNLATGQAIVKVERKDNDFNISIPLIEGTEERNAEIIRNKIVILSRSKYGKPKQEVEELLAQSLQFTEQKKETEQKVEKIVDLQPEKITQEEKAQPEFKEADISIQQKGKEFTEKEEQKRELREHRYLQELIKRMAEGYGFKAVIEEPTPDGKGRVDVGLSKDNLKIACEITVTNTKEYEMENIKKCLNAGYTKVFVCSTNTGHLGRIKTLCETHFSKTELKNITCCDTQELFTNLSSVQKHTEETIVKGYRVKVNIAQSNTNSQQVANTILKSIRRDKK
ncbi:MAG: hypothetical protein POELPBGB_01353 [Bacteroidia bacterium]|nr:hypothetical protein [Bacteroidia bacterium]